MEVNVIRIIMCSLVLRIPLVYVLFVFFVIPIKLYMSEVWKEFSHFFQQSSFPLCVLSSRWMTWFALPKDQHKTNLVNSLKRAVRVFYFHDPDTTSIN